MMNRLYIFIVSVVAFATFAGFGCGGGGGGVVPPTPADKYSVIGTVTGLDTYDGLTIENLIDGRTYFVDSNGDVELITGTTGTEYNFTIKNEAAGTVCAINNGAGIIQNAPVNMDIICSAEARAYSVSFTVSGLVNDGLILKNVARNFTQIDTNGLHTFSLKMPTGAEYVVRIQTQPTDQICTVVNGLGVIESSNITNVLVNCGSDPSESHSVGGTISGLAASGLKLFNNGEELSVSSGATSFQFANKVTYDDTYTVSVSAQPSGLYCVVTNGSGTMGHEDVTNVSVACSTSELTISVTQFNGPAIELYEHLASPLANADDIAANVDSGIVPSGSGTALTPNVPTTDTSIASVTSNVFDTYDFASYGAFSIDYVYSAGQELVTSCDFGTPFDELTCMPIRGQIDAGPENFATAMDTSTAELTVTANTVTSNAITVNKHTAAQLSNIMSGAPDYPAGMMEYGGKVYFSAQASGADNAIFRIDGSTITRVSQISTADVLGEMVVMGENLYFVGPSYQIYKYDGVDTITKISNIDGEIVRALRPYNGKLLFSAGDKLYRYDGDSTIEQVSNLTNVLVNCLNGTAYGEAPLFLHNGKVYFMGAIVDGESQYNKLFEYSEDGSGNPTIKQISNIAGDTANDFPKYLASMGTDLYFVAMNDEQYENIYKYDGSTITKVTDLSGDGQFLRHSDLIVYNGELYFIAGLELGTKALYRYNGTNVYMISNDTAIEPVPSITGMFRTIAVCDGSLYFRGDAEGKIRLAQYTAGDDAIYVVTKAAAGYPSELKCIGTTLYFSAKEGQFGQPKLFKYND